MTAQVQSFTGDINTNGEWESIETLTGITFASGKTYNMQIIKTAYLKEGNAEFSFKDEKFNYKAGSETLYIRTNESCVLSILEVD